VTEVEGPAHRPGAQGFTVHPVGGGGGIWRADLLVVLDDGSHCFHFHPDFKDDDVGERVDDPLLAANPRAWIENQLRELPAILDKAGAANLITTVDMEEHLRTLPLMMTAIDGALAKVPVAAAAMHV
jgi:hypothetical protein